MAALDALEASGIAPTVNLKVFLEGEEEVGSPHLERMLEKHRRLLEADLWLFCDGPVHQTRLWQMVYGVRGSTGFNLTVYGPNRPLHSGHYGNWAPNPIVRLIHLIDSMRDPDGRILIEGYGREVREPTTAELAAIEAAPKVDENLASAFGIAEPETRQRLERSILRPAINLRGIRSGDVGSQSRNSIQPSATASVGLRLVPDQTIPYLQKVIERHIRDQGYFIVHEEPTPEERSRHPRIARIDWPDGGYPAYRTDMDHPLARGVAKILKELSGGTLVQLPTFGGSLPIYLVDQVLSTPVVMLPVANHDNNQHGKDENLRLQNLWDAIEIYAAVLTGLPAG
jgi:acetylornithine deacetylase/succinyl-diaminopimelate desuccinylase-like protein